MSRRSQRTEKGGVGQGVLPEMVEKEGNMAGGIEITPKERGRDMRHGSPLLEGGPIFSV